MFKKKEFITIFIIQITEVLGFSLILPFLPFLAKEYGASPLLIGTIGMSFSLFQFISAPVLGRLSDIYGRKPLLIMSQISTFIGFIILGFANSLPLIFLSRIIDGSLGSNFTITQAYIADISTKEERSVAFGLGGMAFGIGFLVGPGLGGLLASKSFALPSFLAAGLSLLTIIITCFFLQETVTTTGKKFDYRDVKIFDKNAVKKYLGDKKISPYILSNFFFILAHMIFVSNFAIFGEIQMGLTVKTVGYLLTYVGLTSIILRGIALKKLVDIIEERKLIIIGYTSMIFSLVIAAFITSPWYHLISITFFSFGTGILRPLLMGAISKNVDDKTQGELFGVTDALSSVTQISSPIISGFILSYFMSGYLPLLSSVVTLLGLGAIMKGFNTKSEVI